MTIYKALNPKDGVDRLYVSRNEGRGGGGGGGGGGLASIEDSVDASIQRLEYYIEKFEGRLRTPTRNSTDNTRIKGTKTTRIQKWEEKQLYGHFKRQTRGMAKKGKP